LFGAIYVGFGPAEAARSLQKLRIVQDGFKSAAEAEKFMKTSIWLAASGHASRSNDPTPEVTFALVTLFGTASTLGLAP
jgi:hypothetical protein